MPDSELSDYDRVVNALKLAVRPDSGLNPGDRLVAASDLADLLDQGSHWMRVFDRDPDRPGVWHNLALLSWAGLDTARRLPYVFNVLALRPGGSDS